MTKKNTAQTNPFSALKSSGGTKKGRGLQAPPKPEDLNLSKPKPEHSSAVDEGPPPRSYRVSTVIHEASGHDLEWLRIKIRERTGRKPKLAETLELAIAELKKQYKL